MPGSSKPAKGLTIAGVAIIMFLVLLSGSPPSGSAAFAQGQSQKCNPPTDGRVPSDPVAAEIKPQFCHYAGDTFIPITVPTVVLDELKKALAQLGIQKRAEDEFDTSHAVYYLSYEPT
ncbi:MAG TPA: hypothetical protein VKQ72_23295, partial [Aggregatilineales bacterium]|nr:hypothetical protein [Aggregatilineales bacterium]